MRPAFLFLHVYGSEIVRRRLIPSVLHDAEVEVRRLRAFDKRRLTDGPDNVARGYLGTLRDLIRQNYLKILNLVYAIVAAVRGFYT